MKTYRYNRESGELYLIRDTFDGWITEETVLRLQRSHSLFGGEYYPADDYFLLPPSYPPPGALS